MQPKMVARGNQNPVGTPNSFLDATSRGNPLPWNFNIPSGNNASWNTNASCIYSSHMGGNSEQGHPLIYPITIPRGNPHINPIPQWSGQVSRSGQSLGY